MELTLLDKQHRDLAQKGENFEEKLNFRRGRIELLDVRKEDVRRLSDRLVSNSCLRSKAAT